MNCHLFRVLLDDHLDAQLDAQTDADMLAHAAACAACAARHESELHLRRTLRAMPVPLPAHGYAERVLAAAAATRLPLGAPLASRQRRSSVRTWAAGGVLAAGLAIVVSLWSAREPAAVPSAVSYGALPVAHVSAAVTGAVQPVRLVFRSDSALAGVTIEIDLPEGVEIEGYPGQRRLAWQSDLQVGSNLLELPVVLSGPGGVLTATLNHGPERRRFAVQIVPEPRPAATPVVPSPSVGHRVNSALPSV